MTNHNLTPPIPFTPEQAADLLKRWDQGGGPRTSAYYRLKKLATGQG
jgi:hypothetical protein